MQIVHNLIVILTMPDITDFHEFSLFNKIKNANELILFPHKYTRDGRKVNTILLVELFYIYDVNDVVHAKNCYTLFFPPYMFDRLMY